MNISKPAFPVNTSGVGSGHQPDNGMDLRDYFAAKAMAGDWASQNEHAGLLENDVPQSALDVRASVYYRMADAMLKARGES